MSFYIGFYDAFQAFITLKHITLPRSDYLSIAKVNTVKIYRKMECQLAHPANRYLFKVNNRKIRKRWEICPKSIRKTAERHR